jgi:hypothetical protein
MSLSATIKAQYADYCVRRDEVVCQHAATLWEAVQKKSITSWRIAKHYRADDREKHLRTYAEYIVNLHPVIDEITETLRPGEGHAAFREEYATAFLDEVRRLITDKHIVARLVDEQYTQLMFRIRVADY